LLSRFPWPAALAARFAAAQPGTFTIGETGFGTGLNFLACWQLWRSAARDGARLQFLSLEKFPLCAEHLARSHRAWPALQPLSALLLEAYPATLPGLHALDFDGGRVRLLLSFSDVQDALQQWQLADCTVDAWFLDGFAPAKNPEMWSPTVLQQVARLSRRGTTLATFTAAGQVRRDLADAGFTIEKVPGFGRKRDMLRGRLERQVTPDSQPWDTTPWFLPAARPAPTRTVVVVGSGLAGSLVAAELARRGISVIVLDRAPVVAAGGSGNSQGVIYARLSPASSELADFALFSYLHALRHYRDMFASGALARGIDGELNGVLQLGHEQRLLLQHRQIADRFQAWPEVVQLLDADSASEAAGIPLDMPALMLRGSGWLAPAAVCRALLATPGVSLRLNCAVTALRPQDNGWHCTLTDSNTLVADQVVLACGGDTGRLAGIELPLKPIRGQVSLLPWPQELPAPRLPICHEGYLAPPVAGVASAGATFHPGTDHCELSEADHRDNLAQLGRCLPALADRHWQADQLHGRAAVRYATPDYLPLAGPVPVQSAFERDYAPLSANARRIVALRGQYQPGLYVCTGFGSRGLSYGPLAAALVVAAMLDEAPPLDWRLARAVHPARFLIRTIARARRQD